MPTAKLNTNSKTYCLGFTIYDELQEKCVLPNGDVDWDVFLLALDGEVQVNDTSLVLAWVRVQRQGPVFAVNGSALQQVEGAADEIVRFVKITKKIYMKFVLKQRQWTNLWTHDRLTTSHMDP